MLDLIVSYTVVKSFYIFFTLFLLFSFYFYIFGFAQFVATLRSNKIFRYAKERTKKRARERDRQMKYRNSTINFALCMLIVEGLIFLFLTLSTSVSVIGFFLPKKEERIHSVCAAHSYAFLSAIYFKQRK